MKRPDWDSAGDKGFNEIVQEIDGIYGLYNHTLEE